MITIIDTSIPKRHVWNTNAHVETDLYDASGFIDIDGSLNASCHYKHYTEYDTVKIAVNASLEEEYKNWTRPNTHLYVDPSIKEMLKYEFDTMYSTDGSLDRSKFPF